MLNYIARSYRIAIDFIELLQNAPYDCQWDCYLANWYYALCISSRCMVHPYRLVIHPFFCFFFVCVDFFGEQNSYELCVFTFDLFTGFLLVLRQHGDLSHRGPLFVLVTWISLFLLSGVWLKIRLNRGDWILYVISFALHLFYGLSMIVRGSSVFVQRHSYTRNVCIVNQRKNWIKKIVLGTTITE